ncbi:alpha-amylase family protein [Paenibacillus sp. BAC0078]
MHGISANHAPMLNAYPDSMGGTLADIIEVLQRPEFQNTFGSFYILPSVFNTDLDRGFSVINYELNKQLAARADLEELEKLGMDLKLDFILNHASVLSEQFQDMIANGEESIYKDFFIDWNKFWEGHGQMTPDGYIQPEEELIQNMFFRKPGLPILMVRFPDGRDVPYWNTFYQEIKYPVVDAQDLMKLAGIQYYSAEEIASIVNTAIANGIKPRDIEFGKYNAYKAAVVDYMEATKKYLGQMDLNIKSPIVWDFYDGVLKQLSEYGASIVRLDAFAYTPKEPGEKNFLNEPGTWEVLEKVKQLADPYHLSLLPEIHASYSAKNYEAIAAKGYMTYDFFLPGLMIDALENADGTTLKTWADEVIAKGIQTVNMLGCHDGIPLLDLKGLIPEERIQQLIDTVVSRGGMVKDLHGQQQVYYQVNSTYYSALGEDDQKLLMARAIQLFMPGKPQIWYLDLFAGKNDYEAVERAGAGGHKEINRTNLSKEQIEHALTMDVVQKQLEMLRFRSSFPAFALDSEINIEADGHRMRFTWEKDGCVATLRADLKAMTYELEGIRKGGNEDEKIRIS